MFKSKPHNLPSFCKSVCLSVCPADFLPAHSCCLNAQYAIHLSVCLPFSQSLLLTSQFIHLSDSQWFELYVSPQWYWVLYKILVKCIEQRKKRKRTHLAQANEGGKEKVESCEANEDNFYRFLLWALIVVSGCLLSPWWFPEKIPWKPAH